MAKFGLLLPRMEMVEPAGRIARELGMDVVLNQSTSTEQVLEVAAEARRLGADILVARGRQASILRAHTDFPLVEIQLTGLEIARLLHRARRLAPPGPPGCPPPPAGPRRPPPAPARCWWTG